MNPITIVGGGIAGLTLGITLCRAGVPVTLHEAGRYPRHRVCGEFLSGKGLQLLRSLDLYPRMIEAGAREARTVRFIGQTSKTDAITMPAPALCLSRYRLDALMARAFVEAGGDLQTGSRVSGAYLAGTVRATGRQVQSEVSGWRWVGIKAHGYNVTLDADLEMHLRVDSYVGLCEVENGRVNICGLFRTREPLGNLKSSWERYLTGSEQDGLARIQGSVNFDKESFTVVAGLPVENFQKNDIGTLCVGDAVAMIPPLTGNGMSLAVESACLAAPILASYSRGNLSWECTQALVHKGYAAEYSGRLQRAGWVQAGIFHPAIRRIMTSAASLSEVLIRSGFRVTRS